MANRRFKCRQCGYEVERSPLKTGSMRCPRCYNGHMMRIGIGGVPYHAKVRTIKSIHTGEPIGVF